MGDEGQQNKECKLTLKERIKRAIIKWLKIGFGSKESREEVVRNALRLLDELYDKRLHTRKIIQKWYKPDVDAAVLIALVFIYSKSNCTQEQRVYGDVTITSYKCKCLSNVIEYTAKAYDVTPSVVRHHVKYLLKYLNATCE